MSDVLGFVELEGQQVELLPARTVLSLLGDVLDLVVGATDGSGGDNGGGGDHGSSGGIDETFGGDGGQNVFAGDVKGDNYQTANGAQAVPVTGPGGDSGS